MCELFAMNSDLASTVKVSFKEFARHGGATAPNDDGWGCAYFYDNDCLLVKEPEPASDSEVVKFIQKNQMESQTLIAHVRRATRGNNQFRNTHPFIRELGGKRHCFAHNGTLAELDPAVQTLGRFKPIGQTDSEYAFCLLLSLLEDIWQETTPTLEQRFEVVEQFAQNVKELGPINFLYSDSDYLYVHSHKRVHDGDSVAKPPGLHTLYRSSCAPSEQIDGGGVCIATPDAYQKMYLVASVPLTDEDWKPMGEGELRVIKDGELLLSNMG